MRMSLMNVPLVELRSRSINPFGVMRISACRRETARSLSTMSLSSAEPMQTVGRPRLVSRPASGPATTRSSIASNLTRNRDWVEATIISVPLLDGRDGTLQPPEER